MLLQGLLRCRNCSCSMTPVTASKKGAKKYRYYVCLSAQKRGWDTCPSKSIPAAEIEQFVVDQVRAAVIPSFDTWDTLSPADQIELLRSIVAEVAYDGALRSVAVTLKDESAVGTRFGVSEGPATSGAAIQLEEAARGRPRVCSQINCPVLRRGGQSHSRFMTRATVDLSFSPRQPRVNRAV